MEKIEIPQWLADLNEKAEGPKAKKNSARSRKAKKSGDVLEEVILQEASAILPHVDLVFVPPRMKIWSPPKGSAAARELQKSRRRGRTFLAVHQQSTWVDFIALWEGGTASFDAKSTVSPSSWGFGDRGIAPHQHEILQKQAAKGKCAFIYLRHTITAENRYEDYIIPYLVTGFPFDNKSSIAFSKLQQWKMPRNYTWWHACKHWSAYCAGGWSAILPLLV